MVRKAVELAEKHGWFLTRQFENQANADTHSRTTAREIVDAFAGQRLDWWVTGFGTGGARCAACRADAGVQGGRTRRSRRLRADGRAECWPAASRSSACPTAAPPPSHPSWKPHPMRAPEPGLHPEDRGRGGGRRRHLAHPADLAAPTPCTGAASLPSRKASSSARPAARPSPARCRSAPTRPPAPSCCACCPIRVRGI